MDVKFISQGLNNGIDSPAGYEIANALNCGKYNSFTAFVAFASISGINNLKTELLEFKNKGGSVQLFLGVDLHGTSQETLQELLSLNLLTYIVYSPNSIVYHPKIYLFEGPDDYLVIIGSSNFTASGLYQNIEASVCLSESKKTDVEIVCDIKRYFDDILSCKCLSCQLLTQDILDVLIKNKIVLNERTRRQLNNKISVNLKSRPSDNKKLLEKFRKLKPSRPPKGYKGTVVKSEIESTDDKTVTAIIYNSIEIPHRSMWIETGKMTGGSGNILDLSKSGRNGLTRIFGSVEFFGISPHSTDTRLDDITLIYSKNKYKGNSILHNPKNDNWRIQLKGVTDSGLKFTELTNSYPGIREKILMFTKTKVVNEYIVDILDIEEIDKLIQFSKVWGHGGNSRGRRYGITI